MYQRWHKVRQLCCTKTQFMNGFRMFAGDGMDMKHSPAHQGPGTPREDNGGDMNNYSMGGPPYPDNPGGPPPPPNVSQW